MTEAYDGREIVGMDLHRRCSVLVRMAGDGRKLETARITIRVTGGDANRPRGAAQSAG